MREHGSWHDIPVRDKDGRNGVVVDDANGPFMRYLDIKFEDGTTYTLTLRNGQKSDPDPLGIEWEYNPGKWAPISDGNT
jgi:hypothetical protein